MRVEFLEIFGLKCCENEETPPGKVTENHLDNCGGRKLPGRLGETEWQGSPVKDLGKKDR